MKRLYDKLRGTVRISVSGPRPEMILNYCAQNGILFWDVTPCADFNLMMSIHTADKPRVLAQDGKNGMDVSVLSETGGKLIKKSAKRRAIFIGLAAACVLLLSVSSLFLWSIEIDGNEKLTDAEILRALNAAGVEYGAFWPGLSSDEVRNAIVSEMPDIAWMTLNLRSSRAEIIIHERIAKPDIVNEKAPGDIVAAKSGVIRRLSVLEGESAVQAGSAVIEGDVLVSGLMHSETGDNRYVHAMAQIMADTWYEISAQTPLTELKKCETGEKSTSFSIVIGKKRINFFSDSRNKYASCDKINKLKYISLGDAFVLPIGYAVERTTEYETKLTAINESAAAERMKKSLRAELQQCIGDGQIVSADYSVSKGDGVMTVTLRAQCTENIAKELPYD